MDTETEEMAGGERYDSGIGVELKAHTDTLHTVHSGERRKKQEDIPIRYATHNRKRTRGLKAVKDNYSAVDAKKNETTGHHPHHTSSHTLKHPPALEHTRQKKIRGEHTQLSKNTNEYLTQK